MASQLKVDTLTGVTTAGSIDVTGEGNSTTTNLQQGLVNAWHFSTNAASLTDSFNISGGTDNGTGDYSYAFTNSFGNDDFSCPHIPAADTSAFMNNISRGTGTMRLTGINHANSGTDMVNCGTVNGDLA